MKKRQIILSGIAVCLLIAIAWGVYLYHKPHASAADKSTEVVISSDSLYAQYKRDEAAADKLFANKILEVKGIVHDIAMSDSKPVVMLNTGQEGEINCMMAMDSTTVFSMVHKQSEVTVKGKCSGFLMDVNLVDCVIK